MTIWADLRSLHILLDGRLVHTIVSRLCASCGQPFMYHSHIEHWRKQAENGTLDAALAALRADAPETGRLAAEAFQSLMR
ncbi:hypothetical protein [Actinoallomurus sp. NPDC052274]|uniref:hypothetical protein n=1 Tax=Actinoallomurus sp. NPDC052274 TaxID=3155420 RepID=UPI003429C587